MNKILVNYVCGLNQFIRLKIAGFTLSTDTCGDGCGGQPTEYRKIAG